VSVHELIINHGLLKVGNLRITNFKVRWVGFSKFKDFTWHQVEDLENCMSLVADYLESEAHSLEDVEAQPEDES
jgi:hypothetical protein